jgi:hypothetical protein
VNDNPNDKEDEHADKDDIVPLPSEEVEPTSTTDTHVNTTSITTLMSEWKKTVEGQWSSVQEEWSEERERLARARDEWEARARAVDSGLERMRGVQRGIVRAQEVLEGQLGAVLHQQAGKNHVGWANGDAMGHEHHNGAATTSTRGGLVTPPSPRSQSSDSGRHGRRRRRRSSGSENAARSRSSSASVAHGHEDQDVDSGVEMDAKASTADIDDAELSSTTLAEEEDDPAVAAILPITKSKLLGAAGVGSQSEKEDPEGTLATPESSIYKLDSSLGSDSSSVGKQLHPLSESTLSDTREEVDSFVRFFFPVAFSVFRFWDLVS